MKNWKWYQIILFPISLEIYGILLLLALMTKTLSYVLKVMVVDGDKLTGDIKEWI